LTLLIMDVPGNSMKLTKTNEAERKKIAQTWQLIMTLCRKNREKGNEKTTNRF